MRVKGKRILKNGTIAGYVYDSKTKKWNWRFIGRQTGGDRTEERRKARKSRKQYKTLKTLKNSREVLKKTQLLSNELSKNTKSPRNTNFNARLPYQKERNALLNYLDDKVRRTSIFRPKRKKKFRNISNSIRKSVKTNKINGVNGVKKVNKVNVLEQAYQNIGLILAKGTRNDPQRFKNLTNKVVKYRTQRKQNEINTNKETKKITKALKSGQNF